MNDLLKLAPTILGFLGGPAGGLAGAGLEWLASKLGASAPTVDAIKATLQAQKPEDAIALRKIDVEFQEFCLANGIKVDLAQIGVNTEEAKSINVFIAGWRPFVGWVCGAGLAYVSLIEPVARFVAKVGFAYTGAFPVIDTTLTMQVLIGMLGLAAARSTEKIKNAEGNR
jgi:hypothetical protein